MSVQALIQSLDEGAVCFGVRYRGQVSHGTSFHEQDAISRAL